jgi:hypothetical protein
MFRSHSYPSTLTDGWGSQELLWLRSVFIQTATATKAVSFQWKRYMNLFPYPWMTSASFHQGPEVFTGFAFRKDPWQQIIFLWVHVLAECGWGGSSVSTFWWPRLLDIHNAAAHGVEHCWFSWHRFWMKFTVPACQTTEPDGMHRYQSSITPIKTTGHSPPAPL